MWLDKDGRKVFSDRPPAADVPAKNILRQPGGKPVATVEMPAPAASAPAVARAAASVPRPSGRDSALEEKRRQAEAEAADRKKAEEEKLAAARAENCAQAKKAKANFDSGLRVAQVNAKGEREILDDRQRAEEVKRLQAVIARDCTQ
jgi:hypothetical protein